MKGTTERVKRLSFSPVSVAITRPLGHETARVVAQDVCHRQIKRQLRVKEMKGKML